MSATLYNGWYVSPNQYEVGPSSGTPSAEQIHNALIFYDRFSGLGWTVNAISAVLGNIQYESCIDPACVYPKSSFPNGGATLADLDNSYAIGITGSAYGLVQWKGTTTTPPAGNQLVSYAIRHNTEWYDGEIQLDRLQWEYTANVKFHSQSVDGEYWTWNKFVNSTDTPEKLAKVWMICYEGTYSVLSERQSNSRWWYDYFIDVPPGPPVPTDWISGNTFAQLALAYNGQYIPYSQADCIEFVNMVWKDIPAVPANENLTLGTNSIWRSTRTFNTTDPDGNNPTLELWYQDTIANCVSVYGFIPTGALLFHQIPEIGPPPIPPQYEGDGIGNFVHVGIYCGNDEVMQSGGQDALLIPGGGVHLSLYDPFAWTHVAFVVYVDPYNEEPPEPPEPEFRYNIYTLMASRKRRLIKNVKRYSL